MKYQIVYDNQTRLRVRSGKNAFTEYEGYGLSELLLENDFIKDVRTSHRNGSILINYYNIEDKDKILRILDNIGMEDLFEGKPSPKNESNEITNKFYLKIIKKLIKRYLIRPFLPLDIRNAITLIKAVKYIAKGLNSLTSFRIDVDLLDGSAVTGSLLKKDFEPASSMMFLLSISDLLEEYTVQKSKSTFKESLSLNIDTVWLVRDDGTEITYPLADIKKGDKVKIHMGDMIPVDGKIVDGEGMINESSMTGEPLAVHKDIGKTVNAGTVLEEGNIVIEVYSVDQDTRLNNIVELIENSENLKAETESKAVELANSLVPYSFVLTFLTYLFTRDSTKALSVLMVDFSCAIKLTTPLSIISAMREASDNRMMIKGGKFIEKFATADTIVFDKTGTLTHASPKVVDVIPTGNYTRDEVLKMSACIEEHFAHSIAKAIVKQAEAEGLNHKEEHSEVEYIVAHGIATRYNDKRAVIGSKHFLFEDEKVEITEEQKKLIDEKVKENSVIYLAIDNKLEGLICINDPVRDEAKDVITRLKTMGIENIIMLTGDSESGARSIAESIGITNYKSQVLPEDKANIIEGLKEEGKTIIMVGDGINDSPALAAADVSVSMKNSSDIAREVADISLLSDNLYDLITLRILSRKMLDKINSNYHKIVGINGTLIALGILGIITPSTSSTIHNLSTMLLGIASTKSVLRDKDKMLNPANDEIKPINA
ncbi:heavy metal translocating P-type ATPase [Methanobrevibacter boviskoreani]|uniref:heavy metal translocating P-type ATPase n=1 Tax=Methanobrevibacter boviskoreani TaxID=1348249 RepID=UPI00059458C9|nr:heavy metal translocating P-type ATPase [Methanobrevibacter boviskoreani]